MIQFEFDGHKIEFDQVLAGFAWPTDEPGFSVVIGEQYLRKATGDEVHYYNLGETENIKMDALIQDKGCGADHGKQRQRCYPP